MKHLIFCLIITFSLVQISANAQDTIPEQSTNQRIIEDAIEQIGEENDFDFNTQFEQLNVYIKNPLNLNKASAQDLSELVFLSPLQINQFMFYRSTVGNLMVIEELQAVPSFDLATIRKILPYVSVDGSREDYQVSLKEMFRQGEHSLLFRSQMILENQPGYMEDGNDNSAFSGNNIQLYSRYLYQYENRLRYGVTMEKDAGEGFFNSDQPYGFDFYSAHFYVHDLNKKVKDLALGDFQVSFGQGLLMWSGFGTRKSSFVMNTKRIARTIRPYSSVNEFAFMRGGGATFQINDNLEVSTFVSYKNRDANIVEFDTIDADVLEVSSLQISGLHRTPNELEDKNAIQEFMTGASIQYNVKNTAHIAANLVYMQLSSALNRKEIPQNLHKFQGRTLLNGSIDYSYIFRNLNFYGETALSQNGGWATLNGLLVGLNSTMDLAVLHRNYQPDFQSIYTNAFGETSGTSNEKGTYLGLQIQPNRQWKYQFYFDNWSHPWLRNQVDAPSKGYEYLAQITYQPKKGVQVYWRFRDETKAVNGNDDATKINFLVPQRKINTRLHLQYKFTKSLEWRTRIELSYAKKDQDLSTGWLMYQDFIYSPMGKKYSFSTRYALFDTDDYNSRIYAYENDLLYAFSVPAYYYKGSRFYVNLTYKPIRNLTLQARFSRFKYFNQTTIGSGFLAIEGDTKTAIKLQARMKF